MNSEMKCPPVLICGFNRPDCLAMVVSTVKIAAPKELFLSLDYPREGRPNDVPGYEACKKIFEHIDWPCEVHRNYAEKNLGCGKRMQSAITWAFEHVDRVIILEDDCVPHPSFFRFCAELLEYYKDDTRVGMIAGHDEHLHMDKVETYGDSYYFDRMTSIWGWATWRRAWAKFDSEMSDWPFIRDNDILDNIWHNKHFSRCHRNWGDKLYFKRQNTWAGKWSMTMYRENWLSIHPCRNLISNIGSGISSRACELQNRMQPEESSPWQNRKTFAMEFPLKHPRTMVPNTVSEYWHLEDVHSRHWWKYIPTSLADFRRKWQHLMKRIGR